MPKPTLREMAEAVGKHFGIKLSGETHSGQLMYTDEYSHQEFGLAACREFERLILGHQQIEYSEEIANVIIGLDPIFRSHARCIWIGLRATDAQRIEAAYRAFVEAKGA